MGPEPFRCPSPAVVGGEYARLVSSDVPRADPSEPVADVLRRIGSAPLPCGAEVAVVDGDLLLGIVALETLLVVAPERRIRELVGTDVPMVVAGTDRERVAAAAARHGARTVAVVGADGRFHGLVPPERLIRVLFEEHEEDLARLAGSLVGDAAAVRASVEAIPRRLWHRLPWLALGLAGAMLSAAIVASFEEQLRAEVLLAFFVPAVVYMADAVGTQTETVVIRGMSLGVPVGRVAARELVTGLVIGVFVASLFFVFAVVMWESTRIAAVVSLSLFVSTSLATAIAMLLPYLLARLGRDPAFGSGPLATVIQDLFSIVAYFTIAVALLP